jgi:plasmid maintenance system antidote protein VapI
MVKGERLTLVELLRQRVKDSGIPLGMLSRKADVPQSVLHKFVHDGGGLHADTADKLMAYFGLEVTEAKGRR